MIRDRRPDRARVLYVLLFLSGAAALADEVVWVRLMADVFGTTAGATAVVLACFMAGMGAGGLVFGRIADRRENAASSGQRAAGRSAFGAQAGR